MRFIFLTPPVLLFSLFIRPLSVSETLRMNSYSLRVSWPLEAHSSKNVYRTMVLDSKKKPLLAFGITLQSQQQRPIIFVSGMVLILYD